MNIQILLPRPQNSYIKGFSASSEVQDTETGAIIRVNSSNMSKVLLDHVSFLFDIDVILKDIPLREDSLWERVWSLRDIKNSIFEQGITPRMREALR